MLACRRRPACGSRPARLRSARSCPARTRSTPKNATGGPGRQRRHPPGLVVRGRQRRGRPSSSADRRTDVPHWIAQPLDRVGVVARPGLRRVREHARVEPAAAAGARLEQDVREGRRQPGVQVVHAEDVAVEELALAVGRRAPWLNGSVIVRFMSHLTYEIGALARTSGQHAERGGRRPRAATGRGRAAGGSRSAAGPGRRSPSPGAPRTARLRSLTISGSIQIPNRSPSASTWRPRPSSPSGSLRRSTTQSPSDESSSSRSPNQPSSSTNSSTPRSRAAIAIRAASPRRSRSRSPPSC